MFWRFDHAELPAAATLKDEPSDTGDTCHVNVQGASDKQLKAVLPRNLSAFTIVSGGVERPIVRADLLA